MELSQDLFNFVVGVAGTLGSFFMYAIWDEMKEQRKKNEELAEKLGAVEVLVAGQYVRRDELVRVMDNLEKKMDKIDGNISQMFARLDNKADK